MSEVELTAIVEQFAIDSPISDITPFGRGHINTSYRVHTHAQQAPDYLLQKINQHVFRDVDGLMHNIQLVTQTIQRELKKQAHPHPEQAGLTVVPTTSSKSYILDGNGDAWRVLQFIDNSCTHELTENAAVAEKAAKAFGEFLRLIESINPYELRTTIPNFHHLPTRLNTFNQIVQANEHHRVKEVKKEIDFVYQVQDRLCQTQRLLDTEKIPRRVTHNDTKMNNVLFSNEGNALCVIDLDTVMSGCFQFDFSDAVRTIAITAVEDEKDLNKVQINTDYFAAIARGYLQETRTMLTKAEIELLAPAADLLPFIIGLRFLTDYLQGDTYFRTHYPAQNLDRARCQFKLCQDIAKQQPLLQKIIADITTELAVKL